MIKMKFRALICAFGLASSMLSAAFAAERAEPDRLAKLVAQNCGAERLALAEAACVGALADTRILAMDVRIAGLTSSLQAASAAELSAFERGLLRSQGAWRATMEADCEARATSRGAMPAGLQICRLAEAMRRQEQLTDAISGEFAQLTGAQQGIGAGRLELTVPLAVTPPAGPPGDLELEIPFTPN